MDSFRTERTVTNMQFKTAICDDEEFGINLIRKHLETYNVETGIEFKIFSYTNPDDLLKDYTSRGDFDIVFLDVEIPTDGVMKNGISVAKTIRSIPDPDVKIIFVSNYPSYMNMGFDVQASHYLEKNMSRDRFINVMNNIISTFHKDDSLLRIKTGRDEWNLLKLSDIICIKSLPQKRDFVLYCTSFQQFEEKGHSIKSIGDNLKEQGFAFANKYCLVNLRHVISFKHNLLRLDTNEYIEISRHYRKSFLDLFSQNILEL